MKRRLGIQKEQMKYEEAAKKLALSQMHGMEFQTPKTKQKEKEFIENEKKIDQSLSDYLDKRKKFEEERASLRVQAEEFLQNFDEDVFDTLPKDLQSEIVQAYKEERYRTVSLSPDLTPSQFSQLQLNSFLEYINIKDKISKKIQFFSENGNKVTTGKVGSNEKKSYVILEGQNLSQVLFPDDEKKEEKEDNVIIINGDDEKESQIKENKQTIEFETIEDNFVSLDDYDETDNKNENVNNKPENKEIKDEFVPIDDDEVHVELELDNEKTEQLINLLTKESQNKRKVEESTDNKTPEKKQKQDEVFEEKKTPKSINLIEKLSKDIPRSENKIDLVKEQSKNISIDLTLEGIVQPEKNIEIQSPKVVKNFTINTTENLKTPIKGNPIEILSPITLIEKGNEIIDVESLESPSQEEKQIPIEIKEFPTPDSNVYKTPEKVYINSEHSTPESINDSTINEENGFEELFYVGIEDEEYLESEKSKHQKRAQTISKSLLRDTKELLDLLGIPYIDSPYEADSQCAFLNRTGYVDAVISEDNDILLFGGTCVCRNIFSKDEKDVPEMYNIENIESSLGFTRERLIQLGILLGNDYNEGVRNLGIVSATEYVAHFKSENEDPKKCILETLSNFEKWVKDLSLPKKGTFNDKYFKQKVKLVLPPEFPNEEVVDEYLNPKINPDCPSFKCENLNMEKLIEFSEQKMGITKDQLEKQLKPALERRNLNQVNIQSYFLSKQVGNIKSKRLQKAIDSLKK